MKNLENEPRNLFKLLNLLIPVLPLHQGPATSSQGPAASSQGPIVLVTTLQMKTVSPAMNKKSALLPGFPKDSALPRSLRSDR